MNSVTEITIRPINKSELVAVHQLEQSLFGDHCYPDFFFRQSFDCWPEGFLVAVDQQQRILGYILSVQAESQHCAWILSVAVDDQFQGKGIGKRLIAESLISLPAAIKQVKLTVAPDNPARYLYGALGFIEQEVEADYFGTDEPRIVMVWLRE